MRIKSIAARFLLILTAVTAAAASCVKFDDSQIQSEIADIKSRLASLEEKVNTNIADLWQIVNAQKDGILITSVTETDDAWILKFSNGKTATLSKGGTASAPAVGVKQDSDGIYYWTLYGQWLLDGAGNKLPVTGAAGAPGAPGAPGVTPQLKIESGYWYVSTDGGKTWTKLDKATGEDGKDGKDGDAFFKDVTWDDDYVYLTLMDGTKIVLRRGAGLVASIAAIPDYSDGSVKAGTSIFTIRFKVEPESAAESLLYLDSDCFKLSVAYTLTKAAVGDLATLPIYEMEAKDGILTILTDGEALADEFANNKLGASAALFITDGETLSVNSGYFPLYPKNEYNGHGYVDLGLDSGNKFADTNLGAENPWEPGNYYAWGELEPKDSYDWGNYKWYNSANMSMTKYNNSDGLMSFADDNYNDDVARQVWGGEWCIPTAADWEELWDKNKFQWTWTDDYLEDGSNHAGMIVTRKAGTGSGSGNSIFLPATGVRIGTVISNQASDGNYWSSFRYTDLPSVASGTGFESGYVGLSLRARFNGCCIRPVLGKYVPKSVKGVSLDRGTLTMVVGSTRQLTAKVEPADIKNPKLSWTSSDPGVATVAKDGTVTAVSVGTTTVTVKTVDGGFTATCAVTVISPSDVPAPEAVDLGLSVKWANMNVGAISPDDYGDYFAWGETEPKSDYSWPTYKWCNGSPKTQTKYITNSSYGTVDNKTVLDPEDDAAHVNWGGSWRMPTDAEWTELRTKCTWTWTSENGVHGTLVTGPNGKSIFLPEAGRRNDTGLIAGWGYYWSSSFPMDDQFYAFGVSFCGDVYQNLGGRFEGYSVRPVYGEFIPVASISLDKTSLELNAGDKQQLTATVSPSNATAKDVYWESSDESIAKVDQDGHLVIAWYAKQGQGGLVTAVAPGTATITAYGSSGVSASCTVTVKKKAVEPEYVDLGLPSGTKWATFNVGASKPEEVGDCFAWGETEPKTDYSWSTYKFELGTDYNGPFSKYVTNSNYGTVDNKTVLDPEDDAAHVNWGGSWRMPTIDEWLELRDNCTWTWTTEDGMNGRKVTGPNGKSIFLPAAGYRNGTNLCDSGSYGNFWSSSLHAGRPDYACGVYFYSGDVGWLYYPRYYGLSARPVYGEFIPVKSISLEKTSLELNAGDKQQLTATVSPSNATAKDVYWESSNVSVAEVNWEDGLVTAVAPGTATITAYGSSGVSASCTVTVKEGVQAVDLGLPSGLKWASCNVGATRPEEFGDYFAWGETKPKALYDWSTYKWCKGDSDALTKYCFDSSYWGGTGQMDNKSKLDLADDAANANMGGDWRMPTDSDWQELINNCTVTWTDNYEGTGVAGSIFTGKKSGYTGVSIFIPAAGMRIDTVQLDPGTYCFYWTSVLDMNREPSIACYFMSDESNTNINSYIRSEGRSVRAVMD